MNLKCVTCGYDLRTLRGDICPECGTRFDPAAPPPKRKPSFVVAAVSALVVMYAPFGWLLFVNDDASYIRHWLMHGPVLPGLAPAFLILAPFHLAPGQLPQWLAMSIMGAITLAAAVLLIRLLRLGWISFAITLVVAAAASILNSRVAFAIFAA